MVESASLLNWWPGNGPAGSNPVASAFLRLPANQCPDLRGFNALRLPTILCDTLLVRFLVRFGSKKWCALNFAYCRAIAVGSLTAMPGPMGRRRPRFGVCRWCAS